MKIFSLILFTFCSVFVFSQFPTSAVTWPTPTGGQGYQGFYTAYGTGIGSGDYQWELVDINGDGKPDLVITSVLNSSRVAIESGQGSSPYWSVYFNTGNGFSTTATNWPTPTGGQGYQGFYATSGTGIGSGDYQWELVDINGDGKPDLVVTSVLNSSRVPIESGQGSSPYWSVYLNTGNGFSTTATTWPTPTGGQGYQGFYAAYGTGIGSGDYQWELVDLNGDSKPDLVVTSVLNSSKVPIESGQGSSPYWSVYLNTGGGFSASSTTWSTPTGGQGYQGFYAASGTGIGSGDYQWELVDLNGDSKPDLVVTSVLNSSRVPIESGQGSSPYWNVYLNASVSPSGVAEINDISPQYVLYPNPNNGNFTLRFNDVADRSIEVYDITGRLISPAVKVQSQQQFNLGTINAGIYLLRITQNEVVSNVRFVVE